MSRKTRRNRPEPSTTAPDQPTAIVQRKSRRGLVAGVVVLLLVAALAMYALRSPGPQTGADGTRAAALTSEHAPSIGDAGARVHVVEFLDPACETCAQFYPVVKQLLAQNPGRIRLSVRHVAFHDGAEYVVRALEASRAQDRYWEALEALLQSQSQWAPHHTVQPDRVDPILAAAGLDMNRLAADMNGPDVEQRMARDRDDAVTLKITATPEYFVNGRPLPRFGYEELLALVREELDRAY
ncbi:MAG TPA: thioredoxin domain-containing protein [Steroidobacteraceae bacterium]|nr:thioredoxin domain-containing protein [Steroidobacteraceae bacterium]